ncbi:MAG: hypothetical protein C0609_05510, partial [Deltaproteobacteria bacterium]
MTKRLLILDPEVGFSAIANAAARSAGWDSQHIDNPEEALSALSSDSFGALLMPAEIEEAGAADFLKEVRALPGRFLLDVIFLGDSFDFGRRTHNLPLPLPASDLTTLLKSFDVKPGELNLEIDAFEEAMFRITGDMESEEAVAPADGEGEPEKVELSEEAILENGTPPDESDDEIAATTPAGTDEEEMPEPEQEAESDAELPGDEPAVAESQEPSRPDKVLLLEEGWILTDKGGEFDLFAFRVDKDEAGGTFKEPAFGLADITEPPSEPSEDEKLEAALHTIEEEVDEEEAIKALGERAEEEEIQEEPSEEEPSEEEPSEEEPSEEEP